MSVSDCNKFEPGMDLNQSLTKRTHIAPVVLFCCKAFNKVLPAMMRIIFLMMQLVLVLSPNIMGGEGLGGVMWSHVVCEVYIPINIKRSIIALPYIFVCGCYQ